MKGGLEAMRGEGSLCSVVQAFIDPFSNTAQHLVVVSDFPTGPVKISCRLSPTPTWPRRSSEGRRDQELLHWGDRGCNMHACLCLLFCADVTVHMQQLQIQSCKMFRVGFFFGLQVKVQLGFDLALKHYLYNETVASVLLQ